MTTLSERRREKRRKRNDQEKDVCYCQPLGMMHCSCHEDILCGYCNYSEKRDAGFALLAFFLIGSSTRVFLTFVKK